MLATISRGWNRKPSSCPFKGRTAGTASAVPCGRAAGRPGRQPEEFSYRPGGALPLH